MASTNKTITLELSQFIATDKPSWLTDYNGDMGKIDTFAAGVDADVSSAKSDAASAKTTAQTASNTAQQAQTAAGQAQSTAIAAQATAEQVQSTAIAAQTTAEQAQSTASNADNKADNALSIINGWKHITGKNPNSSSYTSYQCNVYYNKGLGALRIVCSFSLSSEATLNANTAVATNLTQIVGSSNIRLADVAFVGTATPSTVNVSVNITTKGELQIGTTINKAVNFRVDTGTFIIGAGNGWPEAK